MAKIIGYQKIKLSKPGRGLWIGVKTGETMPEEYHHLNKKYIKHCQLEYESMPEGFNEVWFFIDSNNKEADNGT